ncbi:SOUL family heme-binding protein [Brumimicrobium oceani]|uniref:Soul heme-binding protein n=1 Tax=Brumimicrobium oceani TaxID=2100725 RepID=A0A2U2X3A5_9FLAO|nr:heme-binding protein [Brumimicrobium oceani]PWH82261.1 soul heme-binding protein [Brumimicrobium oceani]
MKILLIIIGVIISIFIAIQVYAMSIRSNTESYPYIVVKKYESFEVRDYEASLFTTVKLPHKEYQEVSGKGFSILAGYIFGGNDKNEKIAMTSPVAMSLEDSMKVMFMVPKDRARESLPKPNNSQIKFKEEPPKTVAAITFGGWASDEKIQDYKKQLTDALDAEAIIYTKHFFFLGYNPPFDVFNRKNEVIVELESDVK